MSVPLTFDNRFLTEIPGDAEVGGRTRQVAGAAWSRVRPTPVAAPTLVGWSPEVAAFLGLASRQHDPELVAVLGGNGLLPGMDPWAANYGGHQFGHWAGQLGDGRAISLGELVNAHGERWELQLKGAGPTPYSRRADGRAVLRSSIREFLCSEAMFHLGVPTTRALSLVLTGDAVVRDMFYTGDAKPEPGAIVCRVSPSWLRFGSYELPASRGDTALTEKLVDFTITRDYPELLAIADATERRLAWFRELCSRTATLIAHWMRVGFVHGVMNTDNLSAIGVTLDYGPYGWMDDFDPDFTPNTTDAEGRRYRFAAQPEIGQWNLACLAGALVPLIGDPNPLREALDHYATVFGEAHRAMTAAKLGLGAGSSPSDDDALARDWFTLLQEAELDFTLSFQQLAQLDLDAPEASVLRPAAYREPAFDRHEPALHAWLARYAARVRQEDRDARCAAMAAANPRYVLRNYLAQEAIDAATVGDYAPIQALHALIREPYTARPEHERYAARRPEWARHRAGCSMLSCSS